MEYSQDFFKLPEFFKNIEAFHNLKNYSETDFEKLKDKLKELKGDLSIVPEKKEHILSISDLTKIIKASSSLKEIPEINKRSLNTIFDSMDPLKRSFLRKFDGFIAISIHNIKDNDTKKKFIEKYIEFNSKLSSESIQKRLKFINYILNEKKKYFLVFDKLWKKAFKKNSGFRSLANILNDKLKIVYRQQKINLLEKDIKKTELKKGEAENLLKRKLEDIKDFEKKLEQQQTLLRIASNKYKEMKLEQKNIRIENKNIKKEFYKTQDEKKIVDDKLKKNENIQKEMVKKIVEQQKEKSLLQKTLNETKKKLEEKKEEFYLIDEELKKKEDEFDLIEEELKEKEEELKEKEDDFDLIDEELKEKEDEFDLIEEELKEKEEELKEKEEELKEKEDDFDLIDEELKEKEEDIQNLENKKVRILNAIKILEKERTIKTEDKINPLILKELRLNRRQGTVASIGGFLGITTASILARIIGNSTANYISPHKNSHTNIIIGDKKDDKEKLIEMILNKRDKNLSELKNEINNLSERFNEEKKKKKFKSIIHKHKNSEKINLINIINRL